MRKILLTFLTLCISLQLFAGEDHTNPVDSVREYKIPEVIVYSTRIATPVKKLPMKIELIQAPDIQKSGFTELTSLLKNYSSVDVIQYPGFLSSVGIRGFKPSGKYVTVLIDGIPSGTDNIATLGLSGIRQVEVLKGPFSAVYGTNAMGGVINMISEKSKGDLKGRFVLGGGSFSQSNGSVALGGRIVGGLSFDANLSFVAQAQNYETGRHNLLKLSEMEKEIIDPSTYGIRMQGSRNGIFSGRIRLGYDFSPAWSVNLYNAYFGGNSIPTGGSIWGVNGEKRKDLNRYSGSLEVIGNLGMHEMHITPYYNIQNSNTYNEDSDDAFVTSAIRDLTYGMMAQDNINFGYHQLVYGLDVKAFNQDAKRYEAKDKRIDPYKPAYGTLNIAGFAQGSLNFLQDRLNLSAGARFDYLLFDLAADSYLKNDAKKENYFTISPNIGLKYEIFEGFRVHSSFGMGFSAPDAYQKSGEYEGPLGYTRGNNDLKPERSSTIDFGVGYDNHEAGIYADVTYFNTAHKDFIVNAHIQEGDKTIKTFENADKAKMSGLETVLSYDLGSLWDYSFSLRAFMNATFMFDYKVLKSEKDSNWEDMKYVRKQNITFGVEYQRNGFELALNGRFSGQRFEDNWFKPDLRPNLTAILEKEYPDYLEKKYLKHPESLIFNGSIYYNFTEELRAGVNVLNIFDDNYTEKDGYNMPGRSFMFNISYSF